MYAKMARRNNGYTLIELIVVIIIIGIVAAVAVPLMRHNIKKAIMTEAITMVGIIRNMARAYYVEHGKYPRSPIQQTWQSMGINPSDLDGRYFSNRCYGSDLYFVPDEGGWVHKIICSSVISGPPSPEWETASKLRVRIDMDTNTGNVNVWYPWGEPG